MKKREYEKAGEYLNYFSEQDPARKEKEARLYSETGQIEEAYKTYEHLLFLYRKFLKQPEIVYNGLEIKNDMTKERMVDSP